MNKKIISLISLSVLLFSSYLTIFAYSNDQIEAANGLANRGIINEHSDNVSAYNLNDNVLRQEIAAVARGVAGLAKKSSCGNIFSDLSGTKPNTWACVNVEVLVDNNLIAKNTKFRPEDKITKSEAIAMLIKAIGFDYNYDTSSSKGWQDQVVEYAVSMGVVDSFKDYNTDATRGWVFEVANTTIKKDEEIKKIKEDKKYSDEVLIEIEDILSYFE